jgi:Zn-finger nucleic acid-binding protein
MSSLNCPKCNGRLEPVVYQGIEIDRCQQCGGIWFDSQEVEALTKVKGPDILDIGQTETAAHYNLTEKEIHCPRCRTQMIRMLDIDEYNLWYEKCLNCGGIWLDAGEFKQFKRNFRTNNFLNVAKRLFKR